jgi:glyoxylase-like metal-dependent hydrolase (beta-lactamase superfamily II)
MQIGKYDVYRIDAGRYRLDGGAMFGVVPHSLWSKKNPPDQKNRILLALNTLLLLRNGRVILIDSGVGNKFSEKYNEIYAVDYSEHSLVQSLAKYNVQPEDVTDVILTHLHFDHVGGVTFKETDGTLKLQFPNATHYVQKKQLEWSRKGFPKDRASYLKENIDPLVNSDKLNIQQGPGEIFEDIEIILSDGHTVAQQLIKVKGNNEILLDSADLIPTSSHIPIPWVMAYDLYPVKTIEEKTDILEKAATEDWMVFFEHDPEIHCGFIGKEDRGYRLGKRVDIG